MKQKIIAVLVSLTLISSLLAGCGTAPNNTAEKNEAAPQPAEVQEEPANAAAESTAEDLGETEKTGEKPVLDVTEIYGKSPTGDLAMSALDLKLTDEDIEKVKAGDFKAAICMHMLNNDVNVTKTNLIKETLESYGVEVIAVTDGESDVNTMVTNLETVMAMKPDLIISIAYDVNAMVPVFEQIRDAGIKLVFFECAPTGFVSGKDYAALVSTDYYGNGRFAAEYMAYLLGYKGKIALAYYDADVWTCNQRDEAFRTVMQKYPDIQIVADQGYADFNKAGTVADAILAANPDLDGLYATWDAPAEDCMASAQAAGKDNLIITTVDLGENSARILAEGGMIKAIGSPRSYEDGKAISNAALYALIEKDLGSGYVATPTMGCDKENVLEAYQTIFNAEPSSELTQIWNSNK